MTTRPIERFGDGEHDGHHTGFVVVVHYRDDVPLNRTPAHCFGPYETEAEARAEEAASPDDCRKVIIDMIVTPWVWNRVAEVLQ